jgi:hypothetical protein
MKYEQQLALGSAAASKVCGRILLPPGMLTKRGSQN